MMHSLIIQKATRGKQNIEQDSRAQPNIISFATISLSIHHYPSPAKSSLMEKSHMLLFEGLWGLRPMACGLSRRRFQFLRQSDAPGAHMAPY